MVRGAPEEISQVLSVARVSKGGKLTLKKLVREHLGLKAGATAYLSVGDEIRLSASPGGAELTTSKRGDIELRSDASQRLGLAAGDRVALIERDDAVALKSVALAEEDGEQARLLDRETADRLVRVAEVNPMPEELLPRLSERFRRAALRYDAAAYLQGRQSLEAWRARALLGRPEAGDDGLRARLIDERRARQQADGSWDGQLPVTARCLRELTQLGLERSDAAVARAAQWLLARPESPHNPGMFFATDDLLALQVEIADGRKRGVRGRFREIKKSDQKRIVQGDDLIEMPCGPRIMWPNALALEALIGAACETEERVRRAITFMSSHDWCECGYQHGLADWRRSEPMSEEELAAFESRCLCQYRYGGMPSLEHLLESDDPKRPAGPVRMARASSGDVDEYPLRLDLHIQGCEFVTTRAMHRVRDARMRRFARAHLWRFAGRQHAADGRFGPEKYGTGFDQAGILETFARYDHPVVPVAVLRAVPWIVESQNEDGSWGSGASAEATTLAVLSALRAAGDALPVGMQV